MAADAIARRQCCDVEILYRQWLDRGRLVPAVYRLNSLGEEGMMIKPGTLCMLVDPAMHAGRLVTVTGPERIVSSVVDFNGTIQTDVLRYPIKYVGPAPYNAHNPHARKWNARRSYLRPLNDPDSAPADPVHAKRKEPAV
jgi:hypothetical protein